MNEPRRPYLHSLINYALATRVLASERRVAVCAIATKFHQSESARHVSVCVCVSV